jgi:hypothetical protein
MLRRVACLLPLLCLFTFGARSQRGTEITRQPRILILLDGSSSMLQPWSGKDIRFKAAAQIVEGLMDSIYAVNRGVEFGLRVYGHQSPAQNNDCYDSRMEVMFSKNNITQMGLRLASLRPFGVSPIAYSLKQAAENDLTDEISNAYSIILITDGGESCGGNICEVVELLIRRKIHFRPYIISLVDYAPLQEQYKCLGSYLQVSKPEDIGPALFKIVDAYRPMLSTPIIGIRQQVKKDTVQKPVVITPPPPPPVITIKAPEPRRPETTAVLRNTALHLLMIPPRTYFRIAPRFLDVPKPRPILYTPEPRQPEKIPDQIAPAEMVTTSSGRPAGNKPVPFSVVDPGRVKPPVDTPKPRLIAPIPRQLAEPRIGVKFLRNVGTRPSKLAVVDPGRIKPPPPIDTPKPPPVIVQKPDTPKRPVVVRPDTARPVAVQPRRDTPVVRKPVIDTIKKPTVTMKVVKPDYPKPLKPAAKAPETPPRPKQVDPPVVNRKEATVTQLSVFFTDGRGKFYASSPQLQLVDAATGKMVKHFYRTVDANGNPDPQTVAPGTYNLVVASRSNISINKLVIEENKNNEVIIKVVNGKLRFRYDNNPDRPVAEFNAIVNIRFEDGPINQKQKCVEELEYAPGNYHVEISTLPVYQLNTDIDFGATTEIDIPEPGFVQFSNANAIGPVQLFSPLGNKFMRFYGLRITGDPQVQRVRLLPGLYEVHWTSNANTPKAKAEVLQFSIRSNMETTIELN